MSLGLPMLVSNVVAQQFLIDTFASGLSHIPENVEDFSNKVIQLYENPEMRKKMANRGKMAILQQLNAKEATKELISYYEN
jgi:glycosyltransferase involved in cell wall biosynthesis